GVGIGREKGVAFGCDLTLPINAGIAKDLQRSLAAKSPEIPIPAKCQVVDVLNLGDEGGVACCLDIGGSGTAAVHIVSITHLLFDRHSPLFRDIDTYQRRRIKKLKKQRGRSF
ncbi:MAG TPA: hypothetical protein PK677_13860, partial [Acidiphilium sp.]|nr:hypothetical protein [Acidiphilium sp.]